MPDGSQPVNGAHYFAFSLDDKRQRAFVAEQNKLLPYDAQTPALIDAVLYNACAALIPLVWLGFGQEDLAGLFSAVKADCDERYGPSPNQATIVHHDAIYQAPFGEH
ncbi:hypothetical protein [Mangrovicoccus algicola]|uniref:Uncharacterized protein n=1 Tax=Mangrovicoccus algicola TaxID=2771008 RepID=A0A8J6YWL3_9RHOB|nr:hypothetical protein [Mangrovicoccus algicola]MBE3637373.1 hypothetical protein [Mangrovicoccus algicola]